MTTLIIIGLAVWRLSHAIVKEDGPLMILARTRAKLASIQKNKGGLYDMTSCVSCTSFWVALLASLVVSEGFFEWITYSLAFSAVAMALELLYTAYSPQTMKPTNRVD